MKIQVEGVHRFVIMCSAPFYERMNWVSIYSLGFIEAASWITLRCGDKYIFNLKNEIRGLTVLQNLREKYIT